MEIQTQERQQSGGSAFGAGALKQAPNGQFVATLERSEEPSGLTDGMERFASAFLDNGGIGTEAARAAGYASDWSDTASRLLKNSRVRARIQELVQIKLETKGAVVGYGVLMEIAQDVTAPPGVRRHCARDLLELAGYYKGKADSDANPRKSLAEMTREELESVVAHSANVLKAAAKIDAAQAPDSAPVVDATALSIGQD